MATRQQLKAIHRMCDAICNQIQLTCIRHEKPKRAKCDEKNCDVFAAAMRGFRASKGKGDSQ